MKGVKNRVCLGMDERVAKASEATMPATTRVDMRRLAFWCSWLEEEYGYRVRSASEGISQALEQMTEMLMVREGLELPLLEEAFEWLSERGLVQKQMTGRGSKKALGKLAAALAFEHLREQGGEPSVENPGMFARMHERKERRRIFNGPVQQAPQQVPQYGPAGKGFTLQMDDRSVWVDKGDPVAEKLKEVMGGKHRVFTKSNEQDDQEDAVNSVQKFDEVPGWTPVNEYEEVMGGPTPVEHEVGPTAYAAWFSEALKRLTHAKEKEQALEAYRESVLSAAKPKVAVDVVRCTEVREQREKERAELYARWYALTPDGWQSANVIEQIMGCAVPKRGSEEWSAYVSEYEQIVAISEGREAQVPVSEDEEELRKVKANEQEKLKRKEERQRVKLQLEIEAAQKRLAEMQGKEKSDEMP